MMSRMCAHRCRQRIHRHDPLRCSLHPFILAVLPLPNIVQKKPQRVGVTCLRTRLVSSSLTSIQHDSSHNLSTTLCTRTSTYVKPRRYSTMGRLLQTVSTEAPVADPTTTDRIIGTEAARTKITGSLPTSDDVAEPMLAWTVRWHSSSSTYTEFTRQIEVRFRAICTKLEGTVAATKCQWLSRRSRRCVRCGVGAAHIVDGGINGRGRWCSASILKATQVSPADSTVAPSPWRGEEPPVVEIERQHRSPPWQRRRPNYDSRVPDVGAKFAAIDADVTLAIHYVDHSAPAPKAIAHRRSPASMALRQLMGDCCVRDDLHFSANCHLPDSGPR